MKKSLLIILLGLTKFSYSQNIFPDNGNAGIGTLSPLEALDIRNGHVLVKNLSNQLNESVIMIDHSLSFGPYANFGTSLRTLTENPGYNTYALQFFTQKSYETRQTEKMRITGNGNVGIGSINPSQNLTVGGSMNLENPTGGNYLGFGVPNSSEYNTLGSMYSSAGLVLAHGLKPNPTVAGLVYSYGNMSRNAIALGDNFSFGGIKFYTKSASEEVVGTAFTADPTMQLTDGGNLLIGKTSQNNSAYRVDVNGKIRANEIVVNTSGADFVFENGYNLRPIAELEKFVKKNKHLPEIPKAETMQQEGLAVSELQTKLLQKVEELTLYIIQQQKEIDALKKKMK